MAFYKQPCRFCGGLLERDARFCPKCGSDAPFADLCPACLRLVRREDARCSQCGRELYILCPHCGERTFAASKCGVCGKSLTKSCPNPRCKQPQFFENTVCTACGKTLTAGGSTSR